MRNFSLAVLCAFAVALIACGGGSSNSNNVSGNWTATLTSQGSTILSFNALLTQGSSIQIGVSNLSFTTASTCFASGITASSTYSAAASNGMPANSFQLTMQSGASNLNGVNTLTMQGTLSSGSISGTWTITGTGTDCAGTGSFSMSQTS